MAPGLPTALQGEQAPDALAERGPGEELLLSAQVICQECKERGKTSSRAISGSFPAFPTTFLGLLNLYLNSPRGNGTRQETCRAAQHELATEHPAGKHPAGNALVPPGKIQGKRRLSL